MAAKLTYQDGRIQIILNITRVEQTNYHEGMSDFYDERGNLIEQISVSEQFSFEIIDEPEATGFGKIK